jgi:cation diffusion facilitator CzcD-associated flavoprotein CzcO/acetyl esterase/lipase
MRPSDLHGMTAGQASLEAIIVGSGFGGIGMAIALRKAGVHNFVILEKAHDVGGVWRDNSYPGAACDVPSHLYSFSFEPNPAWSRVFATQAEIHAYLHHCASKYALHSHLRLAAEVAQAAFDEQQALWHITLTDGTQLCARLFITATGQLSRPVLPRLEGMETFHGRAFHSSQWDHSLDLAGKRVAVIGTGASATQFVPAITDKVTELTVFQRSPSHIVSRPDRTYTRLERTAFRWLPWVAKLYRVGIYTRYESRALAFTRFKGLLKLAVGVPFRRQLARQVPDTVLRDKLIPAYAIGCKRILLSSDYLPTMAKSNVTLITDRIRRVTADGIETTDGQHYPADVIVYGTGFAATEFLSPMRITGREGRDLNDVWRRGAQAYLGMTVPGFPNFFMLYGPNTNLGHNSIVYMLESQIEHIMRCQRAMVQTASMVIEVESDRYRRFNVNVQRKLASTVWNGCKSWYVDEAGHNSTNWPGFTLTYRWLARHSSLQAYRLTHALPGYRNGEVVATPPDWKEESLASLQRCVLRLGFRPFAGPPWGITVQRRISGMLSPLMPGVGGVLRYRQTLQQVPVEIVAPKRGDGAGVVLYLHGGAFCLGDARTHRSITTRLARDSGMPVWVPEYRLAPEHPYPAALDDVLQCYQELNRQGYRADQIVVAGDSAGGALALALALRLREQGEAAPAGLLLISPVTDAALSGPTMAAADPMIRRAWLEQALRWYNCPASVEAHHPLLANLHGLPPMLVQVGDEEVLLSDATRLAQHAANCGVPCRLEVYAGRWHVFHLSAFYLDSSRSALRRLAAFARERVTPTVTEGERMIA